MLSYQEQNILWDHELAIARNLGVIAQIYEQLRERLPFQKQLQIFTDYVQADRENTEAFLDVMERATGSIPEGHEIHYKRCNTSGVEYCVCMPSRELTSSGGPF